MQRRPRLFLSFVMGTLVLAAVFVRVGYKSLGLGGYVYVDIGAPWKR